MCVCQFWTVVVFIGCHLFNCQSISYVYTPFLSSLNIIVRFAIWFYVEMVFVSVFYFIFVTKLRSKIAIMWYHITTEVQFKEEEKEEKTEKIELCTRKWNAILHAMFGIDSIKCTTKPNQTKHSNIEYESESTEKYAEEMENLHSETCRATPLLLLFEQKNLQNEWLTLANAKKIPKKKKNCLLHILVAVNVNSKHLLQCCGHSLWLD